MSYLDSFSYFCAVALMVQLVSVIVLPPISIHLKEILLGEGVLYDMIFTVI